MTTKKQDLSFVLGELKKDYLSKLPSKLEKLKEFTQNENWDALHTEYHKLKGTGKTYGFPEITTVCERLEALTLKKDSQIKNIFEEALKLIEDIRQSYLNDSPLDVKNHPFGKTLMELGKRK